MDAVILAGGRTTPDLQEATGCSMRGDLMMGGKRLVQIAYEACKNVCSGYVICVGSSVEGAVALPAGQTFLESIRSGLEASSGTEVVLCTADMPFLTGDALNSFISQCERDAHINYAIVPTALSESRYPGIRRTSLAIREGRFTGGNVALVSREAFLSVLPILERAYANRKSPLRLAMQVGVGTLARVMLAKFLPKTLPLRELENRVGRFIHGRVHAVVSDSPEIATDVDNLEQYKAVLEILKADP